MIDEQRLAAYHAAHERAAFAEPAELGVVRLTGRDRLDLLHRISTNDVKKLQPGEGAPTVLANAMGRVMAFLIVCAGQDEVFVRTMRRQGPGVARYLQSMIFWQDQAEVADLSASFVQFALYGPEAPAVLTSLAGDVSELPAYGWRTATVEGAPVSVQRGGPLQPFGWLLEARAEDYQLVHDALAATMPQLDGETADVLRIEAGLPLWERELSDQVTPLETGLLPAISFTKGCYTGQEVIARQTNYDKVTRNLVGLELADAETRLRAETRFLNARVLGPGRGGFVGSAAYSPTLAKIIALAVVPRELAQPGTQVEVVFEEQTVKATVRGLPFIPNAVN